MSEELFCEEVDLKCHTEKVHLETLEQSSEVFECDLYDAKFSGKDYLESHHDAYHADNNVLICQKCDHTCSNKGDLHKCSY